MAGPLLVDKTKSLSMDYRYKPSGKKLPLFLLKNWRQQSRVTDTSLKSSLVGGTNSQSRTTPDGAQTDRIFFTGEIEDRLRRTAAAVSHVQTQIYRGEELYYEHTMPHRNICKGGLEGFVDAKDGVSGESGLTRGLHQSIRKVPGDVRWFSESSISKEAMHRQSLDIVRTASAKKPTMDPSGSDLSSSVRNLSSDIIPLNEMNRDAPLSTQRDVESIYPKRKRKDTEEHGDETPPARKSKPIGLKHGQSSPRAKMNEDYLDRHSASVPSKNNDNDSINNLPSTKDSTTAGVKKDDSKKVDSQRRRRSRRGAKP